MDGSRFKFDCAASDDETVSEVEQFSEATHEELEQLCEEVNINFQASQAHEVASAVFQSAVAGRRYEIAPDLNLFEPSSLKRMLQACCYKETTTVMLTFIWVKLAANLGLQFPKKKYFWDFVEADKKVLTAYCQSGKTHASILDGLWRFISQRRYPVFMCISSSSGYRHMESAICDAAREFQNILNEANVSSNHPFSCQEGGCSPLRYVQLNQDIKQYKTYDNIKVAAGKEPIPFNVRLTSSMNVHTLAEAIGLGEGVHLVVDEAHVMANTAKKDIEMCKLLEQFQELSWTLVSATISPFYIVGTLDGNPLQSEEEQIARVSLTPREGYYIELNDKRGVSQSGHRYPVKFKVVDETPISNLPELELFPSLLSKKGISRISPYWAKEIDSTMETSYLKLIICNLNASSSHGGSSVNLTHQIIVERMVNKQAQKNQETIDAKLAVITQAGGSKEIPNMVFGYPLYSTCSMVEADYHPKLFMSKWLCERLFRDKKNKLSPSNQKLFRKYFAEYFTKENRESSFKNLVSEKKYNQLIDDFVDAPEIENCQSPNAKKLVLQCKLEPKEVLSLMYILYGIVFHQFLILDREKATGFVIKPEFCTDGEDDSMQSFFREFPLQIVLAGNTLVRYSVNVESKCRNLQVTDLLFVGQPTSFSDEIQKLGRGNHGLWAQGRAGGFGFSRFPEEISKVSTPDGEIAWENLAPIVYVEKDAKEQFIASFRTDYVLGRAYGDPEKMEDSVRRMGKRIRPWKKQKLSSSKRVKLLTQEPFMEGCEEAGGPREQQDHEWGLGSLSSESNSGVDVSEDVYEILVDKAESDPANRHVLWHQHSSNIRKLIKYLQQTLPADDSGHAQPDESELKHRVLKKLSDSTQDEIFSILEDSLGYKNSGDHLHSLASTTIKLAKEVVEKH